MAKKAPPVVEKEEEEEEVTCPVCGKPVGLDVASCPYCGAEFEEEEVEEQAVEEERLEEAEPEARAPAATKAAPAAVDEEETAECPVCGKSVSLSVSSCPYCGAEFEEEEVEEVIEVEEKAPVEEAVIEEEAEEAEPEKAVEVGPVRRSEFATAKVPTAAPTPMIDLKVIGIALIILGIIGSQISVMIDWYWTWVPPIGDNLAMFVAIPLVVIVVGLAIFMLIRRSSTAGKKVPKSAHGMSLSVLLFGILAMIMIVLWKPINDALQNNSATVAGVFLAVLVIGVLMIFMSSRMTARAAA